jgi:hypothetical protein
MREGRRRRCCCRYIGMTRRRKAVHERILISNEWCREEKEAEWCRWPEEEREGRCSKPNNKDCRGRGPDSYSLVIRRLQQNTKKHSYDAKRIISIDRPFIVLAETKPRLKASLLLTLGF